MTVVKRPAGREPSLPPSDGARRRLTRWSWAMVPVYLFLSALSGTVLFHALQGPLGIHEGDVILMARSVAGWVAEVGITVVLLAAPVAGVVLGGAAIRRGGSWGPWTALVANAAFALLTLYMFIDDVHMTYGTSWWG